MLRNTADSKADVERFVRRVADADTVWYLTSSEGTACSSSNAETLAGEDGDPPTVLLFFSDSAYAKRAQARSFTEHRVASIKLFDFRYRWLPGMSNDKVLAGPNWTGDLVGLELDPLDLRKAIDAAMTTEHLKRHEEMFDELSKHES